MTTPVPSQQQANPSGTGPPTPSSNNAAPIHRAVRIHFSSTGGITMSDRVNTNSSETTPQNVRRITMPPIIPPPPLPPLEPQPLPHVRSHEEGDASLKKFECVICFEYLDQPVGCGSCPVRFCHKCMQKVVLQYLNIHRDSRQDGDVTVKCPHCRNVVVPSSIAIDNALLAEMNACPAQINCSYEGCETKLTLKDLAQHEKSCDHRPMKCRYASYGCKWTGNLSSLSTHEGTDCHYTQWKQLIETTRKSSWNTQHIINQYYGFLNLNHALIHANRQLISQHNCNCAGNLVYLFQMCWEATMFPDRFVNNRGVYTLINEEERGMVCNMMLLWPWLGVVLRMGIVGIQHFPRLVYVLLEGSDEGNDEMWDLLDTIVFTQVVAVMSGLMLACFYIDEASSISWTSYKVTSFYKDAVVRDIAAVCSMSITLCCLDFFGPIRGTMLWILATNLSLGYTSFMTGMIEKLTGATNVFENARALPILSFGLKLGYMGSQYDTIPLIGSVLVLHLIPAKLREKFPIIFGLSKTECFLAHFECSHAVAIIVVYLATAASMDRDLLFQSVLRVGVATFTLVLINVYTYIVQKGGDKLAAFHSSNDDVARSNSPVPTSGAPITTQRPSPVGACVAAAFMFTSVLIATI